jgi:hypothetical protein
MHSLARLLPFAVLLGIGGTLAIDLWGQFQRRVLHVAPLDLRMLGRWIGHMPRGRFTHDRIGQSEPVRGEAVIGWIAHYSIGIAFAVLLLAIWGLEWLRAPTLGPALIVGLVTIAAPWFLMQPAFGLGIAASRTPDPTAARIRSLVTHSVYGLGLFATAKLLVVLGIA